MDLGGIKLSLIRDNNSVGVAIIQKIEKLVKDYNISINKAITYCISNYKTPYEKRLLSICRSIYPYDGQVKLKLLINSVPTHEGGADQIYYKVGKFTDNESRQKHVEDKKTKETAIGVQQNQIFNTSTLKRQNYEVLAETINPDILDQNNKKEESNDETTSKPKRKRKARID